MLSTGSSRALWQQKNSDARSSTRTTVSRSTYSVKDRHPQLVTLEKVSDACALALGYLLLPCPSVCASRFSLRGRGAFIV